MGGEFQNHDDFLPVSLCGGWKGEPLGIMDERTHEWTSIPAPMPRLFQH
jgi:hypothetical protein